MQTTKEYEELKKLHLYKYYLPFINFMNTTTSEERLNYLCFYNYYYPFYYYLFFLLCDNINI